MAEAVFDFLNTVVENEWVDLALMSLKLVYSEQANAGQQVRDTVDAKFVNKMGARRMVVLGVRMTIFIFQRMLPGSTSSHVLNIGDLPEGDAMLESIANTERKLCDDKVAFVGMWGVLLKAQNDEEIHANLKCLEERIQNKAALARDEGDKQQLAEGVVVKRERPDGTAGSAIGAWTRFSGCSVYLYFVLNFMSLIISIIIKNMYYITI